MVLASLLAKYSLFCHTDVTLSEHFETGPVEAFRLRTARKYMQICFSHYIRVTLNFICMRLNGTSLFSENVIGLFLCSYSFRIIPSTSA